METGSDSSLSNSHKLSIEPLLIAQAQSLPDDTDFSEDYIDSPRSSDVKSLVELASIDSSGDYHSDELSSIGTFEADDDINNATGGMTSSDLTLSVVTPTSDQTARTEEDCEDEFEGVAVPRRSTSLKSGKSPPPGSARQKKEVRFADALGLDLESVKHIMNTKEPPIVPASAVRHLMLRSESEEFAPYRRRLLHTCFSQPGMSRNFAERVAVRRVMLETCLVTTNSIDGVVRVANIAYEKHVCVRYTMNGWLAFTDVPATYVHGSSNGSTDQFRFSICLPNNFGVINNAVEFSVQYRVGGGNDSVFWDSNYGANYRIECYIS